MILTKQELANLLVREFKESILNYKVLYNKLICILEWYDDDPRDITVQDIAELENQITNDLDLTLTSLEDKVKR